ncbi:uncharacterized protein LOC130685954 [Daphnia carinata]|uniref:uncharacterized protein LOC130685954 n=1 Tax=Daphnia carinata TaxID=120202 RepID=UPI00258069C0|nr:uncharacterized protein LOC130685954 [Daphnia carinata]
MSDIGDNHDKSPGHGHRKPTTDSANVPSVLMALTGAAVVAIQTYVFITFGDAADSYEFFLVCNGMAMASGAVCLLTGILCLCCVSSKRSSSTLGFSVFMNVMAAIGAIGSTAVTAMESSRIGSDDAQHPCTSNTSINCSLWFDLEIGVAVISGVNFVLALTLVILISMGMKRPKVREIHYQPDVVYEQTAPSISGMMDMEPVQPEQMYPMVGMQEQPADVQISSSEQEEEKEAEKESTNMSRGPFMEQLKMMSREELERRLGEHMQHQFLEELRQELSRRNLIPINGRLAPTRSRSSSTKSNVPAPQPDYYEEPSGYNKDERF